MSTTENLDNKAKPKTFKNLSEQVNYTLAIEDTILRNLMITQTYHDISRALQEMTGHGNVNWCTFGKWASKTAGTFIRKEEVSKTFNSELFSSNLLEGKLNSFINTVKASLSSDEQEIFEDFDIKLDGESFAHFVTHVSNDVSLYIMQGNFEVFKELAGAFAKMIDQFATYEEMPTDELNTFLKQWKIGEPKPDIVTLEGEHTTISSQVQGGQTMLTESMTHYLEAKFEKEVDRRAELILLANAYGGLHEQMRLQNYIVGSLNVAVEDFFYMFLDELLLDHIKSHSSNLQRDIEQAAYDSFKIKLGKFLPPVIDELTELFRKGATTFAMELELPSGNVKLGRDVPAPPGAPLFPIELRKIDHQELAGVLDMYGALVVNFNTLSIFGKLLYHIQSFLIRFGYKPRRIIGSNASDWGNYRQRMKFIMDLFRSRQQETALTKPPFSLEQEKLIKEGVIPSGNL